MPATTTVDPKVAALSTFLQFARQRPSPTLIGTIPTGSQGGSAAAQVSWVPSDIPDVAAYAAHVQLHVTLPITLTLPANSSVVVSPYSPYSALQNYFTVAGQSQWEYMSGAPFWLDELTSYAWFDPAMSYPSSYGAISGAWDNGSSQASPGWYPNVDGSGAFQPGATISNTTTVQTTVNGTVQFRIKIRLRRRQGNLYGAVPLGDPENRPQLFAQLSALVGSDPTNSMFTLPTGSTSPSAALSSAGTVIAVFHSDSLDLLPVGTPTPIPTVEMALQINTIGSTPVPNAGSILPVPHRTSMIFDKIFHQVINNQKAQACDYFGLWTTQDQQTARWYFDAAENSYAAYFQFLHDRYKRYFPVGCLIADLYDGFRPEFPGADPYRGEMSPVSAYALIAGVRVTPAMQTTFRIPSGTSLTNPKIQVYTLGLVSCSY